jgi:hypothetical protein
MNPDREESFPPYAFVPGGPWPHPTGSPQGHSWGRRGVGPASFERGTALFNAGFYWEAHEVWEALWHAEGRKGPTADLLKGLIKLAAAGVKVRERQPHGVVTHAQRAAALFRSLRAEGETQRLGLALDDLIGFAEQIAANPPQDPEPTGARVARVFTFRIEPLGPRESA